MVKLSQALLHGLLLEFSLADGRVLPLIIILQRNAIILSTSFGRLIQRDWNNVSYVDILVKECLEDTSAGFWGTC